MSIKMNSRLLTINEWLDAIGCDRCYRKDMKETYNKAIPELTAQDAKTRKEVASWLTRKVYSDGLLIPHSIVEALKEGGKEAG